MLKPPISRNKLGKKLWEVEKYGCNTRSLWWIFKSIYKKYEDELLQKIEKLEAFQCEKGCYYVRQKENTNTVYGVSYYDFVRGGQGNEFAPSQSPYKCTCGVPQYDGRPCAHVYKVFKQYVQGEFEDCLIPIYLKTRNYVEAYQEEVSDIADFEEFYEKYWTH